VDTLKYKIASKTFGMGLTCNNENGFVLGFTILFMAVLTILGSSAVVMNRGEIKVSANYKNSELAFFAAQGGTEHAREVLRELNAISTDPSSFSDELVALSGSNGFLDGYLPGTDDVPIISASLDHSSYTVYLTNDVVDGVLNSVDSNNRVALTSVATGPNGSAAVIRTTISTFGLFPLPATITLIGYGASFTGGNSNAKELHGDDQCGSEPSKPVVAVSHAVDLSPLQSSINGSKPATYHTLDKWGFDVNAITQPNLISTSIPTNTIVFIKNNYGIDLLDYHDLNNLVASLQKVATTIAPGGSSAATVNVGSPGDPKVVVVTGHFTLNGHGAGILVVTGQLTFNGNVNYDGLILVIGEGFMQRNGAGNGTLNGGIVVANTAGPDGFPGNSDDSFGPPTFDTSGGGNGNVNYCSTSINDMVGGLPLRVLAFKHLI
jgi:hypothetical protein